MGRWGGGREPKGREERGVRTREERRTYDFMLINVLAPGQICGIGRVKIHFYNHLFRLSFVEQRGGEKEHTSVAGDGFNETQATVRSCNSWRICEAVNPWCLQHRTTCWYCRRLAQDLAQVQ